jgi:uncharacterized protein YdcH (DUF465 family)
MEPYELELIEKHKNEDNELRALWNLHRDYEKQLDELSKRPYLKPSEEMEVRELKKKKLAGKTKLQQLLDKYRTEEAS